METVLIIEDDSSMQRGLKDNFEYAGFKVIAAADGEAGLSSALDACADRKRNIAVLHCLCRLAGTSKPANNKYLTINHKRLSRTKKGQVPRLLVRGD